MVSTLYNNEMPSYRSDMTWIRQHEEDKRRKREEKEAAKRLRQQQEHRNEEKAKEYERARRMSFNTGYPPVDFPATQSAGHPGSPYQHHVEPTTSISGAPYGRERKHSNVGDYDALNRQLGDMDLNRESGVNGPGYPRTGPYGSKGSTGPYGTSHTTGYAASGSKYSPNPRGASELPFTPPGGKYSPNPGRAQLPQFTAGSGNPSHPSSVYSSSARGNDPIAISASPYGVASSLQPAVYPRGHILEGQPTRSRASSLIQGPPAGAYVNFIMTKRGHLALIHLVPRHLPEWPVPRLIFLEECFLLQDNNLHLPKGFIVLSIPTCHTLNLLR